MSGNTEEEKLHPVTTTARRTHRVLARRRSAGVTWEGSPGSQGLSGCVRAVTGRALQQSRALRLPREALARTNQPFCKGSLAAKLNQTNIIGQNKGNTPPPQTTPWLFTNLDALWVCPVQLEADLSL